MQRPFNQSAVTPSNQLQRIGDAYRRANSFIRFENSNDLEGMKETVLALSPAERNEWAQLWKDVADKHESLSLPKGYYDLLDAAHHATWQVMKADLPANARQLRFDDRIAFMQKTADTQALFWKQKFPDVFSDFGGTRVVPVHHPIPDQYSLVPSDVEGTYEYRAADIQERFDVWTHVAAHEPQHAV